MSDMTRFLSYLVIKRLSSVVETINSVDFLWNYGYSAIIIYNPHYILKYILMPDRPFCWTSNRSG